MKFTSLRTSGVAAVAGIALASSLLFGASTVANAQAVSLSQLVQLFISLGIIDSAHAAAAEAAVANMGTTASASSYTYTRNLTVGSTGADVTALQNAVGISPATGYFGALTKAAVAKWQASVGLPATGFFGPLSMAKLNAAVTTTTTTTTSTTATNTSSPVATNTGVEGILTTNLNAVPSSGQNVYAGDSMDSLLGIKLQAQLSPITIQRVQVNLGTNTQFYTDAFSTLYLVSDTGQVLAQAALNSNTVTKETSGSTNTYYLTFSGFNYTVPGDNSVHVLTIKGDLYQSIDLTQLSNNGVMTIGLDNDAVRGVDGAGIDQYGPTGAGTDVISNTFTVNRALSTNAQLQVSTDPSNPLSTLVVANTGGNLNEADGVTTLIFDLFAQKDNISLQNLAGTTTITVDATHALPTTAYLYDGSNLIGSAPITFSGLNGTFSFNNLSDVVNANTTKALTIKEDIKNADTTSINQTTTVIASGVNAQNSIGNTIISSNLSGSATGNSITVIQKGPVFSLVGTPTLSVTNSPISNNTSTSTLNATFNVNIQAVGSNVYFGDQSASSTFGFGTYVGGVETGIATASSTNPTIPSNGLIPEVGTAFILQQNNSVQIPVNVLVPGKQSTGALLTSGSYAVGLDSIRWSLTGSQAGQVISNFMAGQTAWRTSAISFP